jgi:hydrogenase large subunit
MSTRITIDPITRIEGHLRIDLEVEGGKVNKAYSSGTMWRGIEVILQGRDPRDAWTFVQRICGVCTTVHAIASVRSVESALGLEVPLNAELIRNIIISAHSQHDHIVHFYHLSALDWVDVVSALKADPKAASDLAGKISNWPGNSVQALTAVKEKLTSFVKAGQLGPFTNGYWGHPAMKLPPEVNLLAVAHYLQALDVQRTANQVVAILGSKTPNIQNLAVGGVANAINLDSPSTLNMEKLYRVKDLLSQVQAFITQVYLPDVAAVAGFYPDWFKYGAGVTNYLAVPDMPTTAKVSGPGAKFDLPGGIIMAGAKDLEQITHWGKDQPFFKRVTEGVARSYYEGKDQRNPWQGETKPSYTGDWQSETPAPEKYSWVKAPRLDGKPVQVGPLAQVLVGFLTGHELTTKYVKACIDTVKAIHKIDVTPAMLHSTLGRHAARAIRCAMMGELSLKHWGLLAENIGKGDTAIFVDPMANLKPGTYEGVGVHEAPRGTLSHWCVIEADQKSMRLKNYQAVVPSTWNAGPRDEKDQAGPYEACLVGNPIADPKLPLEALRTVHSFDPCLACAIHTHDADGTELGQVKVTG